MSLDFVPMGSINNSPKLHINHAIRIKENVKMNLSASRTYEYELGLHYSRSLKIFLLSMRYYQYILFNENV